MAQKQTSRRVARQVALRECVLKTCKIRAENVNDCLALALGDRGSAVKGGNGESEASQDTLALCQARDTNCKVEYVDCNFPERIR